MELLEKREVLVKLTNNPHLSNNQIAEQIGLTAQEVGGVRAWFGRKGADYLVEVEGKLAEQNVKIGEFRNVDGKYKKLARLKMAKHIDDTKLKFGRVLTLPWKEWALEKVVSENASKLLSYDACESNPAVFLEMVANSRIVGRRNVCYPTPISDRIYAAKEGTYDHALLDYCGALDKQKEELMYALQNNIVKVGGIIAVTLTKARSKDTLVGKLNALRSELSGETIKPNCNASGISMFFKAMCALTDFEVVEEFYYKDKGKSPMTLTILKRTR